MITLDVQNNKDDLHAAIDGLDQFTKNWCMNVAETEKGELTFRCNECPFTHIIDETDHICRIKAFATDHDEEYCEKIGFGAMSL